MSERGNTQVTAQITAPRQPGELRSGDRVITLDRARDIGHVVEVDGDQALVAFAGCGDKPWSHPVARLARHWTVERDWNTRGVRVSARHPLEGTLYRGTIRRVGLTEARQQRWQVTDYDHQDLGIVVGDYIAAERTLLAATDELDTDVPVEDVARAVLRRSGQARAREYLTRTGAPQ
jgi:hypothetical protein